MLLNVAFLDVFHGDCAVVTFNQDGRKACIVVDGGEKRAAAKRLAAYLKHEKVEVIDLLVATHIDSDHVNGLVHFLKSESGKTTSWNKGKEKCIRYYWGPKPDPDWAPPPPTRRRGASISPSLAPQLQTMDFVIQSVKQNQQLSGLVQKHIINADNIYYPSLEEMPALDIFDGVSLEFLAPDVQILDSTIQTMALSVSNLRHKQTLSKKASAGRSRRLTLEDLRRTLAMNAERIAEITNRNANNQSIVFKLTPADASGWSFLFTGDAEHESWEMMRHMPRAKKKLAARVLKVPHHGSINGIDKASFKVINPEYSIISVGQKHGLPDAPTLNLIKQGRNRKLFCTERNYEEDHPGACIEKRDCIRGTSLDFRSLRFVIDTDSSEEKIEMFLINTGAGKIDVTAGEIWCPENEWPTK
jgi:beta-lactamase superfamily II metal-dependent hydrolase